MSIVPSGAAGTAGRSWSAWARKAVFWRQSDVPEVCELTWLLGSLAFVLVRRREAPEWYALATCAVIAGYYVAQARLLLGDLVQRLVGHGVVDLAGQHCLPGSPVGEAGGEEADAVDPGGECRHQPALPKTRLQLLPPKPKELDSTRATRAGRGASR